MHIYKSNTPSCFTNLLNKLIQLNTIQNYEIALTNYHLPAHEAILHGNDFDDSIIEYNMAVFHYDKTTARYSQNLAQSKNYSD